MIWFFVQTKGSYHGVAIQAESHEKAAEIWFLRRSQEEDEYDAYQDLFVTEMRTPITIRVQGTRGVRTEVLK